MIKLVYREKSCVNCQVGYCDLRDCPKDKDFDYSCYIGISDESNDDVVLDCILSLLSEK